MNRTRLLTAVLLVPILTFSEPLLAASNPKETIPSPLSQRGVWTVGVGSLYVVQPYRGLGVRFVPIPLVTYRGRQLNIQGPRVSYDVIGSKKFGIGFVARYRFAGYDPDDSDYLRGMERRRDTIDGGLIGRYTFPGNVSFTADIITDLLKRHNGHEWNVSLDKKFPFGKFSIGPEIQLRGQSDNLASYYFGVRDQEATAERPAYRADSAINSVISIGGRYSFTEKHTILFALSREFLSAEIYRSPIVEEKALPRYFLAYVYRI